MPFALHTLDTWQRPWRATDLSMEKMMSQYWINFIKTGSPNGKGLTQWHAYESNATKKIKYGSLNNRQKESYNFQKVSSILAEYGFVTMKLNDDWQGADFIAQHIDGNTNWVSSWHDRRKYSW